MTIPVLRTVAELRDEPLAGRRAVVTTMGALHEGHSELIRVARERVGADGTVIVTVFVNPTQFAAGEDFERYPRMLDEDVAVAHLSGADCVFAPDVREVYGGAKGFGYDDVTVDPGPLGDILEGASRPGHYRGVLTVVAKLFAMTQPDEAMFGEKDYQQLVLIRRMARNLSMPVEVVGVPTVREADGLAMSSRNRYLDAACRRAAAKIPAAVRAVADNLATGTAHALAVGRAVIDAAPLLDLDYLAVTGPELEHAPTDGPVRVLIAVRTGGTRLIDNLGAMLEAT